MPLRLAMLGMDHPHAAGIARQVAEHPDEFVWAGMFDPQPEVAARQKQSWSEWLGDVLLFDDSRELLDEPLDGVVVEGRIEQNVGWARMALERGLPVMLEKPAGINLTDFQRLSSLAARQKLPLQMIYLFRYMSAVQKMFEIAASGALGHIYQFRARLPKDLRLYDEHEADFTKFAGGMFFEMAGHLIDFMVHMLGRPETVTPFLAHHHRGSGELIDNALAVFGYPDAWGVVDVSALESASDCRRIELFGTEGACVIRHLGSGHLANNTTQPIDVYSAADDTWVRHDLPAATLQIADLREFAACIAGDKTPTFSYEHDLIVHETLMRACGVI